MSFDSAIKKAAAHPFSTLGSAAPKSVAPATSLPMPVAAPQHAPAPAANAKTGQALSSLFSFMTDAGVGAKAAPQAMAKPGLATTPKTGAVPSGPPAAQAAPDPQKAELAAKMAAKTLGKAAPPEQKVAIAAKMAAKATGPEAPSEQKAALKEKLAAAVQAAPDSKKAELVKKVATATAGKEEPAANKVAHFAPNLAGGAPQSARAPMPQMGGGGPEEAEDDRKVLDVDFQQQDWGHWCGPASTRIALSARMDNPPTQGELADQLGTHGGGTDHIGLITSALNDRLGTGYYENKLIPGATATDEERDLLWKDIVTDIDNNYPIVANIVAPPSNHPPGYPDDETIYHYVSIIGYDKGDQAALIADPAKFNYRPGFESQYWMGVDKLADLIARKGYSA
jgi:hypothetical protein